MTDLSTLDARKALAGKYATKYGLDVALVCSVVEQESGWNSWAMRYEPLFYSHYIQPLLNNGQVHTMTEATARATSYGLMQLMGQVAREFGFKGQFLTELCDPDTGLDWGCQKLAACLKATATVPDALLRWNGGGNPQYANEVLARMSKYE